MAGPHPLVSQARHALAATFSGLTPGARVLIAVSGGADSMALAASAAYAARAQAIQLYSITVDHGLRKDSREEAHGVAERLSALGINTHVVSINAAQEGSNAGLGPEGAARTARYVAIAAYARKICADLVLLGHHADDQAETVLLGLARGSGARSLAGMPAYGDLPEHLGIPMARPFLGMRSADLRTVCRELGVTWVDDPTNDVTSEWRAADGSALTRNDVRHRVIPLLVEVLGSGVVQALGRTASRARADDEALTEYAKQALAASRLAVTDQNEANACGRGSVQESGEPSIAIDAVTLAAYPQAVRTRALRIAALESGARGGELFYSHITALDKLISGKDNNLRVDLPGAHAWKHHGVVWVYPGQSPLAVQTRTAPDSADS